jgi:glucokinase
VSPGPSAPFAYHHFETRGHHEQCAATQSDGAQEHTCKRGILRIGPHFALPLVNRGRRSSATIALTEQQRPRCFGHNSISDCPGDERHGGGRELASSEPVGTGCDVVLGVDIGATKTALLAWNLATGAALAQDVLTTPTEIGPEAMVDRLVGAIDALLAGCGQERKNLRGIGVAVPGLVDAEAGVVLTAGNLAGWSSVPLRDLLEAQLDIPVVIEHDANAAAFGERWRGAARNLESFAFVALGTGIGVGIVLNGKLHRGAHHAAGELGDLVVGREYLGQERGGQGNLAQLIGGKTLRRRAKQATGDDLSAADAISHAEEDPELAAVADEAADFLAMAIIAIAALLDPEAIIVGGGTAEAGEDLLDPVRERVAREVPAPPLIIASAFGSEAQLHGAVFAVLQHIRETD